MGILNKNPDISKSGIHVSATDISVFRKIEIAMQSLPDLNWKILLLHE